MSQHASLWTSAAEIAANRNGTLTEQQQKLFRPPPSWLGLVAPFILIILCGGIPLLVLPTTRTPGALTALLIIALLIAGVLCFFIIPNIIWNYIQASRRQREIASGQIAQVQGQVAWHGSQYAIIGVKRRLRLPDSSMQLPPPGLYQFYYLQPSGILLSAEPLRGDIDGVAQIPSYPENASSSQKPLTAGEELARSALLAALAQTNGFAVQDLQANREGRLSVQQAVKKFLSTTLLTLLFIIFSAPAVSALGALIYGAITHVDSTTNLLVGLQLFLLFCVLGGIFAVWRGISVIRRPIITLEGIGTIRVERTVDESTCYYVISQHAFTVNARACSAFTEDIPYRVHYTARGNHLLSIEPLLPPPVSN